MNDSLLVDLVEDDRVEAEFCTFKVIGKAQGGAA